MFASDFKIAILFAGACAVGYAQTGGCVSCHGMTDSPTMHTTGTVALTCVDCHGGNNAIAKPAGVETKSRAYTEAKLRAHPHPKLPQLLRSSANPVRPYADWLRETAQYIQFVNPGDLRIAQITCGKCHAKEVRAVSTSMMTHGGMLWQAALYNNGAFPYKDGKFGESYTSDGLPRGLRTWPPPTEQETRDKGILPSLDPLPRWELSQPGNLLRVFERGGGARGEIGSPSPEEEPGLPDDKLSDRGLGTLFALIRCFWACRKLVCWIPSCPCRERMIMRVIIGIAGARPVT